MANTIAEKVQAITGVATAETEFVDMGKKFVLNSVPKRVLIDSAVDGSNIVNSSGQTLPEVLISVRRNNRFCREVSEAISYAFDLTNTFTITVSAYSTIVADETIVIDGITITARATATTETLDFIPETSNNATAQNIADAIGNIAHLSATVLANIITITGATPLSETLTGVASAQTTSTTSLYNATELFPVFYKRTGKLYIKPDPTASAIGVVNKVDYTDIGDETEFDNIIVNYAASMEFTKMAQATRALMATQLAYILNESTGVAADIDAIWTALDTWIVSSAPTAPTFDATALANVTDALLNADKFVNESQTFETSYSAHSAGYWIYDEDIEMVQASTTTAAQELNRAKMELEKLAINLGKYQAGIQAFSGEINEESSRWQGHIQKAVAEIQEINGRIATVNAYGVVMNQDLQRAQQYYKFAFEEVNRIAMNGMPQQPQEQPQQEAKR